MGKPDKNADVRLLTAQAVKKKKEIGKNLRRVGCLEDKITVIGYACNNGLFTEKNTKRGLNLRKTTHIQ